MTAAPHTPHANTALVDGRAESAGWGEYALYSRTVRHSGSKVKIVYFFSKHTPMSGSPAMLPPGYEVVPLASGPTLRRKRGGR